MHPTKFRFIWQGGFRGEDILEINQSETRIVCWVPYLWTNREEMNNRNRELSIDAYYEVSVHLAKQFQKTRI
jgi:hypothetical protein